MQTPHYKFLDISVCFEVSTKKNFNKWLCTNVCLSDNRVTQNKCQLGCNVTQDRMHYL